MGKIDTCTKDYVRDNTIFADIFNQFIYKGEQKITPEQLRSVDTTEISVPYGIAGSGVPTQKYRDHLKILTVKEDQAAVYMLLGVENQSKINYAMPVKCMVYDALNYAAQVEKIVKSHKAERDKKRNKRNEEHVKQKDDPQKNERKVTSGEYLTGFYKEDFLVPVVTLVVYFGANEWDGPRNLHQMFAIQNEELLALIPDYRINLLTPQGMSDEEIEQFRTDFREVILFCKYMGDKKKLAEIIKKESGYKNMERKAIRVIEEIANVRIKVEEKEGKGNMCEGLQGIIDDAAEEARMKMSLLIQNLRKDGREGDIDKMCLDKDYYDQLLKEYKIK